MHSRKGTHTSTGYQHFNFQTRFKYSKYAAALTEKKNKKILRMKQWLEGNGGAYVPQLNLDTSVHKQQQMQKADP